MRGFHFGSMLLPGIPQRPLGRDHMIMDPWLARRKNRTVKLHESLQYKKCTCILYLTFFRHFSKKCRFFTKWIFLKYYETLAYYFFLYCLFASSQINYDEKLIIYHLIYILTQRSQPSKGLFENL